MAQTGESDQSGVPVGETAAEPELLDDLSVSRWPLGVQLEELRTELGGMVNNTRRVKTSDPAALMQEFLRIARRANHAAGSIGRVSLGLLSEEDTLLAESLAREKEARLAVLSPRQREVLELLAHGGSNVEIGKELDIEERTVKFHLLAINKKTGTRNRVEAALMAREAGLGVSDEETDRIIIDEERYTERELTILKLLAQGLSNSGIARVVEVSEGTVKAHLTEAYKKLGVKSRTEASVMVSRSTLMSEPGSETGQALSRTIVEADELLGGAIELAQRLKAEREPPKTG